MNETQDFDLAALAELIARRWQEDRTYITLNRQAQEAWLEGSWWWRPRNTALKLHWSRWSPALQRQIDFARMMPQKEPNGGDLM
jgi:hypothetical protein